MSGRKPKPIEALTGHYDKEEIEKRQEAEPSFQTQKFEMPDEISSDEEKKEWGILVSDLRLMENCPVADCDRNTMLTYVKALVSFKKADREWLSNPKYWIEVKDENGKVIIKVNENYTIRKDMMNLIAKLKSDLCLDVVSRAKVGAARSSKKEKDDIFSKILNRGND